MALDLRGVEAKIDRAFEHRETLDGEIESWVRRYPYGLRTEIHDEGRTHIGFLEIYRPPDSPRFGLLVGECVHNFRTALDYLIRAVAEDTLSTEELEAVENRLAYPICSEPTYWDRAIKNHRVDGAGSKVLEAIETRQPYHGPDPPLHPLSVLQELDDRDKHRLLHTFVAAIEPREFHFIPDLPGPSEFGLRPPPYEHGSEIFKALSGEPRPNMQVQCEMTVEIRIRELVLLPEDVRVLLAKLGATVQRIVSEVTKAHAADIAATAQS